MTENSDFVVVSIVQGGLTANILKSHLESQGIPVVLQYETAGILYGITVDGLGEVRILVPEECAEEAKKIIEPKDCGETEE
jgi:hypothetical protein